MAAQDRKFSQQLADVQKYIVNICISLPKYRSKLSSDNGSWFQEFFRRILKFVCEIVQSRQRETKGSVTEYLAPFQQILQTLESGLSKKLPNT